MKFLARALFLVFLLLGVLIAVSNTERTELSLWPIPMTVVLPLYMMVLAVLLLGVLAGLGLGWWAGRHHRENDELRAALAAAKPPPPPPPPGAPPPGPAPREQRAIERQTALVAPEPFKG